VLNISTLFFNTFFILTFTFLCLYLQSKLETMKTMKKAKSKVGRKEMPEIDRKVAVTVYVPLRRVNDLGGIVTVRDLVLSAIG